MANDPFTVLTQLGPGFYGIFLPFVFTFAIVFGLLEKVKVIPNTRINAVLALVLGLFVTAVGGPQLAAFFISISSGAAIFLAGFLILILMVTLFGYGGSDGNFRHMAVLAVVIIIGIVLFLSSTGGFINLGISPDMANLIFVGIVLIAVVWFVAGSGEAKKTTGAGAGQQGT